MACALLVSAVALVVIAWSLSFTVIREAFIASLLGNMESWRKMLLGTITALFLMLFWYFDNPSEFRKNVRTRLVYGMLSAGLGLVVYSFAGAIDGAYSHAQAISDRYYDTWKYPIDKQHGPVGPILALEMRWEVFHALDMYKPQRCLMYLTQSPDSGSLREVFTDLFTNIQYGAGCSQYYIPSLPAGTGAPGVSISQQRTTKGITFHFGSLNKIGDSLLYDFRIHDFNISMEHALPSGVPDDLIWIDIGPGSPWK
jgi:hypothetical protein